MIKKLLVALPLIATSTLSAANENYLMIGAGTFAYTGEVSGGGGSGEFDENGGNIVIGGGKKLNNARVGGLVSLPNSESDTIMYFEGFGNYMLNDYLYVGGVAGFQNWTSEDGSESLDLSGLTLGLSAGFEVNNFDVNFTYRFLNGSTDSFELFGTSFDTEIASTTQFTVSYQLPM